MGWLSLMLGQSGRSFGLRLVNRVTHPLAGLWWFGPLLFLFACLVVPIMRRRHNIMAQDDYGRAARFWWAPGWPWLGLVGAGLALLAAPLLHPALAARWAPSAWFGLAVPLSVGEMTLLLFAGFMAIIWGLKHYIQAWFRVRQERYRAWQWRKGARPQVSMLPKGCPYVRRCAETNDDVDDHS